jgi:hypothetical protein
MYEDYRTRHRGGLKNIYSKEKIFGIFFLDMEGLA